MTNKEAIKILKPLFEQCKGTNECLGYIEHYFSKDEEKAFDLAIKALEDVDRLEEENHENFLSSQHIISVLMDEIKKLRGEEE